jgi:hypothetical protein
MHHSKRFGATLALGLLLALAGCNRSETPPAAPPTPPPAPSMAPVPFAVRGVSLGNAIGADKRVTSPTSSFAATDTIYASVATEGAAPSVTLTARWTYQDGQLVSETSETIAPSGPAATEFHIAKPDGWPAGSYKVEISANGMPATSQSFTVVQ